MEISLKCIKDFGTMKKGKVYAVLFEYASKLGADVLDEHFELL